MTYLVKFKAADPINRDTFDIYSFTKEGQFDVNNEICVEPVLLPKKEEKDIVL